MRAHLNGVHPIAQTTCKSYFTNSASMPILHILSMVGKCNSPLSFLFFFCCFCFISPYSFYVIFISDMWQNIHGCYWASEWVGGWVGEWVTEWASERASKWLGLVIHSFNLSFFCFLGAVIEWVSVGEWVSEWVSAWANKYDKVLLQNFGLYDTEKYFEPLLFKRTGIFGVKLGKKYFFLKDTI